MTLLARICIQLRQNVRLNWFEWQFIWLLTHYLRTAAISWQRCWENADWFKTSDFWYKTYFFQDKFKPVFKARLKVQHKLWMIKKFCFWRKWQIKNHQEKVVCNLLVCKVDPAGQGHCSCILRYSELLKHFRAVAWNQHCKIQNPVIGKTWS